MDESKTAIVPNTISLLLVADFKELDEYRDSTNMIIDTSNFVKKLRKSKYPEDSILEYLFCLGMMAKERIDEARTKFSEVDISHNELSIIELDICL